MAQGTSATITSYSWALHPEMEKSCSVFHGHVFWMSASCFLPLLALLDLGHQSSFLGCLPFSATQMTFVQVTCPFPEVFCNQQSKIQMPCGQNRSVGSSVVPQHAGIVSCGSHDQRVVISWLASHARVLNACLLSSNSECWSNGLPCPWFMCFGWKWCTFSPHVMF